MAAAAAAGLDRQVFSGERPNHDPEEYLDWVHIQALHLNANTKPERELVFRQYFRQGLRGRAKVWFDALPASVRRDWPRLEDAFSREFKQADEVPNLPAPGLVPTTTATFLPVTPVTPIPQPQQPSTSPTTGPAAEEAHREGHPLIGLKYPSLEAAEAALKAVAREDSYALSLLSKSTKTLTDSVSIRRVVWSCSKARRRGKDRRPRHDDEGKRRKTTTQMTGCPFRIAAKLRGYSYEIQRINSPHSLQHNHPKPPLSSHPQYRRDILNKMEESVIAKFRAGETPSRTLECLRDESEAAHILTIADLRNRFQKYRADEELFGPPMT